MGNDDFIIKSDEKLKDVSSLAEDNLQQIQGGCTGGSGYSTQYPTPQPPTEEELAKQKLDDFVRNKAGNSSGRTFYEMYKNYYN